MLMYKTIITKEALVSYGLCNTMYLFYRVDEFMVHCAFVSVQPWLYYDQICKFILNILSEHQNYGCESLLIECVSSTDFYIKIGK